MVASAVAVLALAGIAEAQQTGRLEIYQEPRIVGTAYVGYSLNASGGAWRSPNPHPSRTESWWEWWRCPSNRSAQGCDFLTRNVPYTIASSARGEYIFLVRYVRWRNNEGNWDWKVRISDPVGRVTDAPPPPPPPPSTPTPVPTVAPTPAPTFEAVPTPVPTTGPILTDTPSHRRAIRPFPVVRMRGRLTRTGARVTVLSVRAPKSARVIVRCKGRSCPKARWSPDRRKKKLTRVRSFERSLRSGTRISVTVSRNRYIGKRTVFVIRRGRAPKRVDNCINSKRRVTRCPAGI
jgi:hypothetical protein